MSTEDKATATAKTFEGKIQEAVGKVTGDVDTQVKGQTKQAEVETQQETEKAKKNENIDIVN